MVVGPPARTPADDTLTCTLSVRRAACPRESGNEPPDTAGVELVPDEPPTIPECAAMNLALGVGSPVSLSPVVHQSKRHHPEYASHTTSVLEIGESAEQFSALHTRTMSLRLRPSESAISV